MHTALSTQQHKKRKLVLLDGRQRYRPLQLVCQTHASIPGNQVYSIATNTAVLQCLWSRYERTFPAISGLAPLDNKILPICTLFLSWAMWRAVQPSCSQHSINMLGTVHIYIRNLETVCQSFSIQQSIHEPASKYITVAGEL